MVPFHFSDLIVSVLLDALVEAVETVEVEDVVLSVIETTLGRSTSGCSERLAELTQPMAVNEAVTSVPRRCGSRGVPGGSR